MWKTACSHLLWSDALLCRDSGSDLFCRDGGSDLFCRDGGSDLFCRDGGSDLFCRDSAAEQSAAERHWYAPIRAATERMRLG
jgi:hypothetical protein